MFGLIFKFFNGKSMFFGFLNAKPCRTIMKLPHKVSFGPETFIQNADFGHVRTYSWLHKKRNTQGKIYGTYLGNICGIYKESRGAGGGVGHNLISVSTIVSRFFIVLYQSIVFSEVSRFDLEPRTSELAQNLIFSNVGICFRLLGFFSDFWVWIH